MRRFHKIVDRCLQVFVGMSIAVLVILTFVQVVGRYIFGQSYGWIEELSVLLLCWTAWATACLLLKDNRHLVVSVLVDRIPAKYRRFLRLFMGIVVLVFLLIVIYASKGTIEAMADIRFISFDLPINMKFLSVPVGAGLLIYYQIRGLYPQSKEAQGGNH